MSGKKPAKKTSASKPVPNYEEEAPRRPNTLGLIVLVAGGISTWYWYKPLPSEQTPGVYSDWMQAEREGLWSSTDLIRPTLDSLDTEFPNSSPTEVEGLVEDSKKLVPVPVYRQNLEELLENEPVPIPPPANSASLPVQVASPKTWTNSIDATRSPNMGLGDNQLNSSSNRSLQARSLDWPDQNYNPSRPQPAPQPEVANNAPALLPMSASSSVRGIRTNEESYGSSQTFSETSYQSAKPPVATPEPLPSSSFSSVGPSSESQIIRQPRRQ